MHTPEEILKKYWGYDSFRGEQRKIISHVLSKRDTLALLPTGGGKSVCFQIPSLMMPGLCIVVSPLIALIKDQVTHLKEKNIPTLMIHSGMTRVDITNTFHNAIHGNFKFLYISPERLDTDFFQEYLPHIQINLIAVDEAHCISQFGYDFRPSYLRIATCRAMLPHVPFIALTASATPEVQNDIIRILQFSHHTVFRQPFTKPNLSLSVRLVDSKMNKTLEILEKVTGTAIIYCKTRKQTKKISDLLNLHHIDSKFYHAGLSSEERELIQEQWIQNDYRVIVCTTAFGMGIDKPDVRCVIHYDVPDCLENYYQEVGRAGRDGKKSYGCLLYHRNDIHALLSLPKKKFPPIQIIRGVYQSILNYLQIPLETSKGEWFDFDLKDFILYAKVDPITCINSLQILVQEEIIEMNEGVFMPAQAGFCCTKETLVQAYQQKGWIAEIVKTMLRMYEGIFEHVVPISEKHIAKKSATAFPRIVEALHILHQQGVLYYKPQQDQPTLRLLINSVDSKLLEINYDTYFKRKKSYSERVQHMVYYVDNNNKMCRSVYIADYFGNKIPHPCYVCDICIQNNKRPMIITSSEFEEIQEKILLCVKQWELSFQDIVLKLHPISIHKIKEVIDFLQREERIQQTDKGMFAGY